jgi:hypothetical protein
MRNTRQPCPVLLLSTTSWPPPSVLAFEYLHGHIQARAPGGLAATPLARSTQRLTSVHVATLPHFLGWSCCGRAWHCRMGEPLGALFVVLLPPRDDLQRRLQLPTTVTTMSTPRKKRGSRRCGDSDTPQAMMRVYLVSKIMGISDRDYPFPGKTNRSRAQFRP